MKTTLLLLLCTILFVTGCVEKTRTLPWSKKEVQNLQNFECNTVPLVVLELK